MKKLIVATRNPGKVSEMKALLSGLPLAIVTLDDLPEYPPIEEDQTTFAGNALKKAEIIARTFGEAALADDSGLEVDYLDGRPGVYSARFAGPGAEDAANNDLLLQKLQGVPSEKRGAVFKCVIALALPGANSLLVEGSCRGRIGLSPCGGDGFGYDPLFIYEPAGLTFAQMESAEKNKVSHRGQALRKLRVFLEELLAAGSQGIEN